MVHELFASGAVAPGSLAAHVSGLAEVRALVAAFPPEAVAETCGIDAATIREITARLAAAPRAAVYGRIGTTTVRHGTVASWLVDVLNVLTGNLDRPGGVMFPLPAHSRRGTGTGAGFTTGRWHSRVRGLPEVLGELPTVTLADEIETPGEGQVRALITIAGNPVLSLPNSDRLDAAIGQLDFVVCVDPYVNATTRHAHVLLPPPPPSQQAHYDVAFYHFSVRNIARYSPPAVPLAADALDESDILLRLVAILSGRGPDVQTDGPAEARRILDSRLQRGPYGLSLDRLLAEPHGVDLGPLEPRIPEILRTPSGRIELCPEPIAEQVSTMEPEPPEPDTFVVIGRRHLRTNNSWMHNVPALVKGRPLCTLVVNRGDAQRLGLSAGGLATVTSRVGTIELTVDVTDDIAPGVVSIPHGFGHDLPGVEMSVARGTSAGVNTNVLTDDLRMDPLSGTAVLNGIPVRVAPAR
jgi:anaerobic selenocysteine-containing dehydrogenase